MRIFSLNSRLYHFCTMVWQLLVLNTVFLLSCLPLVTIGASLIALNASIEAAFHDEYSLKNYWKTWVESLKIGSLCELATLVCIALIGLPVAGLAYIHAPALLALPFLVIFALVLLAMPLLAILPARNPSLRSISAFPQIISTTSSVIFSALLPTIGLSLSWVSILLACIFAWQILPLGILLGFALASCIQNSIYRHFIAPEER